MNPLIVPAIPMAFAFLLPFTSKFMGRKGVHLYAIAVTLLTLIFNVKLFVDVYSSTIPLTYAFGNWRAPVGILYEADRLGVLLAMTTSFLMFVIAIYSTRYLGDDGIEWYHTLYLGLEAGLLGIFLTGDAFNLFVMLEVAAVASYGLVMFYTEEGYPAYAGLRYAIISSVGTTLYFLALAIIYKALGTVNFADIAAKLRGIPFPISQPSTNFLPLLALAMALTTWAFTIKSAIMPNHFWLPGAHSAAPSPVSAVLSGLVVNAGLYGFMRFLTLMDGGLQKITGTISTILIVLGAISALLASIAMILQDDAKRIVAYSTILNMGYIAIAVGIGTFAGLRGAVFHMVNHAVAKALLFLAVGVFIHSAGTRKISELAGLGRKMPLTTLTMGIATISLVGLPPTNVFFSKLTLYGAYLEKSVLLVIVLIVSSLFALASYMRMFYWLWVRKPARDVDGAKDDPIMGAVLLMLALLCVAGGILSPLILEKLIDPAVSQLMNVEGYIKAALLAGVK